MKRILFLLFFWSSWAYGQGQTCTFIPPPNSQSPYTWHEDSHWSCGHVPTVIDEAIINATGIYTLEMNQGQQFAYFPVKIEITNPFATLKLQGATPYDVLDILVNSGTVVWTGGNVFMVNTVVLENGTYQSAQTQIPLQINQQLNVIGDGQVYATEIINKKKAEVTGKLTLYEDAFVMNTGSFLVDGTISQSNSTKAKILNEGQLTLLNTAIVQVETLNLGGTIVTNLSTNATFEEALVNMKNPTNLNNGTITGNGAITASHFKNDSLTVNGNFLGGHINPSTIINNNTKQPALNDPNLTMNNDVVLDNDATVYIDALCYNVIGAHLVDKLVVNGTFTFGNGGQIFVNYDNGFCNDYILPGEYPIITYENKIGDHTNLSTAFLSGFAAFQNAYLRTDANQLTLVIEEPQNNGINAITDYFDTPQNETLNLYRISLLINDLPSGLPPYIEPFLEVMPQNGTLFRLSDNKNLTTGDSLGVAFQYIPNTGFTGRDSFSYSLFDPQTFSSDTAYVHIDVFQPQATIDAVADTYNTTEDTVFDTNANNAIGLNDVINGTNIKYTLYQQPQNGVVQDLQGNLLSLGSELLGGQFRYVPNLNFNGADRFVYQLTNNDNFQSDTASVFINVSGLNDLPVALNDSYTTNFNTVLNIQAPGVLGNDTDVDSQNLSALVVTAINQGTLALNANGGFVYTPPNGFTGVATFQYVVADAFQQGNTATVTITVGANPNQNPIAQNDSFSGNEDTVISGNVLTNDSDPNQDPLTASLISTTQNGTLVMLVNGNFTFTPNQNYFGAFAVQYQVSDGKGGVATANLTITVNPVNDAPVAQNDAFSGNEDVILSGSVGANDNDVDAQNLTFSVVTQPANGALTFRNNGTFDFTPAANFNGQTTFTYQVSDGALSATATVTLTINPVNDAPIAVNDSYNGQFNTQLIIQAPGVLSNDIEVDGQTMTAVGFTTLNPQNAGTLTPNANGGFTFIPANGFSGIVTFRYQVTDVTLQSNQATVTINVGQNPNVAPVAQNDTFSGNEDTQLSGNVLGNDTDQNQDPLTAVLVTNVSQGTLQLNANGSFTYTPVLNFNGQVSFTYQANDGQANSNTATVTLTINAVNDAPVAQNDSFTGTEDTVLNGNVSVNDSDIDSATLTYAIINQSSNGTVILNPNGNFSFTPDFNYNGQTSFTYRAFDGALNSNTATVNLNIVAVNDPPIAGFDTLMVNEDVARFFTNSKILQNDFDYEQDPLTISNFTQPTNGSLSQNANGFIYTPNLNYVGSDSFTYTISDGNATSTATVNITVSAVNDAPIAVNDSYSTNFNTALNVLAPGILGNDSDVDSQSLSAVSISLLNPTNAGTLQASANGGFLFTPSNGFSGATTFTYQVSDGALNSNLATVTINVGQNPNVAPIAQNDIFSGNEDTQLSGNVLGNDTDQNQDPLTAVLVTNVSQGTLNLNANGSFTYTPIANFNGQVSFTYQANDGQVNSNTVTVTLTINAVNDAPIAQNDSFTGTEDTVLNGNVSSNDSDIDSQNLVWTLLQGSSNGTVSLNPNGSFSFTPNANFNGQTTFAYQVSDGSLTATATVTLNLTPVNDAPVAVNNSYGVNFNTTLTVAAPGVLGNDSDVDSPTLTAVLVTASPNGMVNLSANGGFTFTPNTGFSGATFFTYVANDGSLNSNTVTVNLNVGANPNQPPTPLNDSFSGNEDTVITGNVLLNDTDPNQNPLTATLTGTTANGIATLLANGDFSFTPNANYFGTFALGYEVSDGQFSISASIVITVNPVNDAPIAQNDSFTGTEDTVLNGNVSPNDSDIDSQNLVWTLLQGSSNGTVSLNPNGSFSFTPNANFNGQTTFIYQVSDGSLSTTATVTLNLTPVNDAPIAVNDSYSTNFNTTLNVPASGVLGNDSDVDSQNLTVSLVIGSSNGMVQLNPNGGFTFTPSNGFSGVATFTYQVSDGSLNSNIATVSINVGNNPNVAPVAQNDTFSGNEDTQLSGNVLGNDTDQNQDPITAVLVTNVSQGTLQLNANGSFTYTPVLNFNGQVSFTYQANDGQANSNVATVTLTVNAVNDAPLAVNDSFTGNEDTILNGNVSSNDSDVDSASLTFQLQTQSANGTVILNNNGTFTFTPNANFSGQTTFTYRISDGSALSNVATVTLNITPINDAPIAINDSFSGTEDTVLNGNVSLNDTDADGNPLTATVVQNVTQGTLLLNQNGTFSYTPPSNFTGQISFTYQVTDGTLNSNTATVTLTFAGVNDAPVAVNDSYTTPFNTTLIVNAPGVLSNDTDIDGDALTVLGSSALNPPTAGNLSIAPTGRIAFMPTTGFSGLVTFTYTMSDGQINATATVSITVANNLNVAPVAQNDTFSGNEDTQLSGNVLLNDTDQNQDPITAVLVTNVSQGTLQLNTNGSFTYTPIANFNGQVSFTYQATDGQANSNTATVTLTINPVNDAPIAVNDSYSTAFNTTLTVNAPGILSNDTDVDGDALTVLGSSALNPPTAGNLAIAPTGRIVFIPTTGFSGLVTFTYTMGDGQINATATVSITVLSTANRAPIAINDVATTQQSIAITIAVLNNDTDPDGNPLSITSTTNASNGAVQIVAPQIRYTPNPSFTGTDSFTYTISDGVLTATATVNITINGATTIRFNIIEIPATKGLGINDNGEVVGITIEASTQKAFKWTQERGVQLLTGLAHPSQAIDLNEDGEVVGMYRNASGQDRPFSWTSTGGMKALGTLGGDYGVGLGINRNGVVVGASNTASGMIHAFKTVAGLSDIHTFVQNHSEAYSINLSGDIAGLVHDGNGNGQAFFNNQLLVASAGSTDTRAYRINNANRMVGSAQQGTNVVGQFWNSTTATLLPAIAGGFAEAYGLNDSGWIVGASTTTTAKESSIKYQVSSISTFTDHSQLTTQASTIPTAAVLWLNHTPINLNSVLLNGAGWTLIEARDVNNRGQIIGYGKLNGQLKTFLLTPQNSAPVGKEDIVMDMSQPINLLVNDIDADGDLLKVLTVRGTNMDKVAWTESGEFRFLAPPSGNETYFYIVTDQNGASIDTAIRYNPNVANDTEDLPTETALLQNYPNPFERETTFLFQLPQPQYIELVLFDALGRSLTTVVKGTFEAGTHEAPFNQDLPNGTYFLRLKTQDKTLIQRITVLK